MPIYAYRCESCGYAQDVLQKLSDPHLTVCPHCGSPTFTKQVTAAAFRLKGSGWYVTDFRNEGSGKPNDAAHGSADGVMDVATDGAHAAADSAHGTTDSAQGTTDGAAVRNGLAHKDGADAGTTGGSGAADAGSGASPVATPASDGAGSKS